MTFLVQALLLWQQPGRTRGRRSAQARRARGQRHGGGDERSCTPVVAQHRGRLERSPHGVAEVKCMCVAVGGWVLGRVMKGFQKYLWRVETGTGIPRFWTLSGLTPDSSCACASAQQSSDP